ncbi:ribulokinase [Clostridium weizhouense]|uniref:Ribulokinase n=1 Tax=Clostridium weizhouense TaxID=2859781 RepID=A0ABS7ALM1_9CLOT|nr:ribulokinase [Clostridium weizhouense]MBW6409301.1 ribulokinase [Clostridium weizhouense]
MDKYAIGIDFGTLSVRTLLIDIKTGEELITKIYEYPHGVMVDNIPTGEELGTDWALQHPKDYEIGLIETLKGIIDENLVNNDDIVGIGVDFTSSTILPTTKDGTPLCYLSEYEHDPHAYAKLWNHHSAQYCADEIYKIASETNQKWLSLYGGKISSEWMIPKIMQIVKEAPKVYEASGRILEACDWITWLLTGEEVRSACAAGYKAFYHHEMGYPSKEFFSSLDKKMENIVEEKLSTNIKSIGECLGYLTKNMAEKTGLKEGTPVGVSIIDAHASVAASKIDGPGKMLIIMGTSSCHMLLSETEEGIPGVCGIVKDGILPGYFGYEAGQCCVGNHFAWFKENALPAKYKEEAKKLDISDFDLLNQKLENYKVGESGLIALDWFNGVRSTLMDFDLTGMILGMTLKTKPEEIYRALIEATAYGTRVIIEQFEKHGVPVNEICVAGGIPLKNPMLLQIYADVCNKEIKIIDTKQSGALGSAILGIAAAKEEVTGYKNANDVARQLGKVKKEIFKPIYENAVTYDSLYKEYLLLNDYFGKGANDIMKRLKNIKLIAKHK